MAPIDVQEIFRMNVEFALKRRRMEVTTLANVLECSPRKIQRILRGEVQLLASLAADTAWALSVEPGALTFRQPQLFRAEFK